MVASVDVLDATARDILRRARAAAPAIVETYDPTTSRARVTLGWVGQSATGVLGRPVPLPAAPVAWLRGGGCSQASGLLPGDTGLVVVCSRSIDRWMLTGGAVPLESDRCNEWQDGVFLPGLAPLSRPLPALAASTWYSGRDDGSAYLSITQGTAPGAAVLEGTAVRLGAAAVHPAVRGDLLASALSTYTSGMAAALISTPPGTAPQNAALLAAIGVLTQTLAADLADILSAKVLVE